jgi:hypothetical protein
MTPFLEVAGCPAFAVDVVSGGVMGPVSPFTLFAAFADSVSALALHLELMDWTLGGILDGCDDEKKWGVSVMVAVKRLVGDEIRALLAGTRLFFTTSAIYVISSRF